MEYKKPKVVIIGAGLAGLAAAYVLQGLQLPGDKIESQGKKLEIDILVLESENFPGGRVLTSNFGDSFVESGAQWLHDTGNAMHEISRLQNLLSSEKSREGEGDFLRDDGFVYPKTLVKSTSDIVDKILENCESFKDADVFPVSVGEYLNTEFLKEVSKVEDSEVRKLYLEIFDWFVRYLVIDNSCIKLNDLSAKSWGLYYGENSSEQDHINYKNGFSSFIKQVCTCLPTEVVQYNKTVKVINWEKCFCAGSLNAENILVECNDETSYTADYVILTVSLGILKDMQKNQAVIPPLPEKISTAISNLGFTGINKIFLQFDSNWWGDLKGIQFVWKECPKSQKDQPDSWIYDISGFDVLYPGPPNTLLGWIGGLGAAMMESLSPEEVAEKCVSLLKQFTQNDAIPLPKNVLRTQWIENPKIRGSYSFITPDCDASNSTPECLQETICDDDGTPRILLAGEACHKTQFATAHGAFDSGIQQARHLKKYLMSQIRHVMKP